MKVIELILDEQQILNGVQAISIVEKPAIESDFITLSKQDEEIKLATISEEKRILLGAALIPDKLIPRKDEGGEDVYYIHFSKDTVRKASELFLKLGRQGKSTLEHKVNLEGLTVVETWIKEDDTHDKSKLYNLEAPLGTWFVAMKVENEQVWDEFVKTGKVKGFSIEGMFSKKEDEPEFTEAEQMVKRLREIIQKSNSN